MWHLSPGVRADRAAPAVPAWPRVHRRCIRRPRSRDRPAAAWRSASCPRSAKLSSIAIAAAAPSRSTGHASVETSPHDEARHDGLLGDGDVGALAALDAAIDTVGPRRLQHNEDWPLFHAEPERGEHAAREPADAGLCENVYRRPWRLGPAPRARSRRSRSLCRAERLRRSRFRYPGPRTSRCLSASANVWRTLSS